MPDNHEDYISLYYDHYKDTFEQIKGYLLKRDKNTIVLIVLLAIISFFSIDSGKFADFVNQYLNSQFGINGVSFELLNSILLFALLLSTYNYYQICVCIERAYKYLHNVENTLSGMMKMNIDRESSNYLNKYPAISELAHLFYVYVIPLFIIFVIVLKIIVECSLTSGLGLIIDILLSSLIVLSSFVYLFDRFLLSKNIGWEDIWPFNRIKKQSKQGK